MGLREAGAGVHDLRGVLDGWGRLRGRGRGTAMPCIKKLPSEADIHSRTLMRADGLEGIRWWEGS